MSLRIYSGGCSKVRNRRRNGHGGAENGVVEFVEEVGGTVFEIFESPGRVGGSLYQSLLLTVKGEEEEEEEEEK